jgi:hypothetical protein
MSEVVVVDASGQQSAIGAALAGQSRNVVELKVHGVSGTPATTLLEYPTELIELVYGDGDAGFHRRRDVSPERVSPENVSPNDVNASAQPEPNDEHRPNRQTEAFCWGGLTSGPATRALWLLFLPFIFVNLAHWMLPPTERKRWASWSVRLLRLLGLTLTMALSLSLLTVAVDIVGWQCTGLPQCAQRFGPLAFMSTWSAGLRLAVTSVPVLAMAGVLLLMQKQNPRIGVPPPDAADVTPKSPLTQPNFWNGDPSVTRLRDCHLTVWFSLASVMVLAASAKSESGAFLWPTNVLLVLNGCFVAVSVGLTFCDRVTARGGPGLPRDQTDRPSSATRCMWLSSLMVCVASLRWVSVSDAVVTPGPLPHLGCITECLVGMQFVLLLGLLLTTWRSRLSPTPPRKGYRPTLKGMTAWWVTVLAWLISGEMSVAVGFWVARLLGEPVQSEQAADALTRQAAADLQSAASGVVGLAGNGMSTPAQAPSKVLGDFVGAANSPAPLQLPDVYFIGSAVNVVAILAAVCIAVVVGLRTWWHGRGRVALWTTWGDYGGGKARREAAAAARTYVPEPAGAEELGGMQAGGEAAAARTAQIRAKQAKMLAQMNIARIKVISSVRAWAALTDRAPSILVGLITVAVLATVVVVGCTAVIWKMGQGPHDLASLFGEHHPAWTLQLLAAGQAITALVATGAIGLAYRAFRNRETRRRVAVLWDVVTFWPRASHPLGPPCYGERAVPDLWLRTSRLTDEADVVIAAHSQGSVIAAAAMLMNADAANPSSLDVGERPLLSQPVGLLTFGCVLRRLYARNFPAYFGYDTLNLLKDKASAGATPSLRWLNLWALTDPLGGWVFVEDLSSPSEAMPTGSLIDRRLTDADGIGPVDGGYPPVCGHSGFWTRPEYKAALSVLEWRIAEPHASVARMRWGAALAIQNLATPVDDSDATSLIPYRLPGASE